MSMSKNNDRAESFRVNRGGSGWERGELFLEEIALAPHGADDFPG